MKKTKLNLVKPIDAAINVVISEMTGSLVSTALASGWDEELAQKLKVVRKPVKGSITRISAEMSDDAFEAEYGRSNGSPKATVRKFMAASKPWEKHTAKLIEQIVFKSK